MLVSVILLNWNGWKDTIECLESLLQQDHHSFRVIVCDNDSSDDSLAKIKDWAQGKMPVVGANPQLAHLIEPPVSKPVPYVELDGSLGRATSYDLQQRLVLIQNGSNLGFAGGCNVGLRYAKQDPECQFFWLLNNDTVVDRHALAELVQLMTEQRDVGLCGSINISYYQTDVIQARGGKRYSIWTARVLSGEMSTAAAENAPPERIDFVNGASMLVSRAFLDAVGLMDESYFLYFEELDWAVRAKGRFSLGYAPKSRIYHKEGASIGTHRDRSQRSIKAEQYLARNRVFFTKRYFPWALPVVVCALCAAVAVRLIRGDWRRARAVCASMLEGLLVNARQQ